MSNNDLSLQMQQLPQRLLYALERGWYEAFDARVISADPSRVGGDLRSESRFLQIHQLVREAEAHPGQILLHMQNVLSGFRHTSHSLAWAIHGEGGRIGLYAGVRQMPDAKVIQPLDSIEILRQALSANFPGIALSSEPIPKETCEDDIIDPVAGAKYLACLTGVPSLKQESDDYFAQGIDRLVDSLRGQDYTFLILAEPIPEKAIAEAMEHCRILIEEIHGQVRQSVAESSSTTTGQSTATSASATLGGALAMLFGLTFTKSWTNSYSDQRGLTHTLETIDKTAEFCEETLEHYLNRLQQGRNQGFWTVGIYIASSNQYTCLQAQGLMRGLFSGRETVFEPLRAVDLSNAPESIRRSLQSLRNPAIAPDIKLHPLGAEFQSLGTPLTTEELSILTRLPQREVPGLKAKTVVDFNLNPPEQAGFEIGHVLYRGTQLDKRLTLSPKSLNRHTFITGLTGSGKTNTCLALLTSAYQKQHLNFLVVDPAKTEYRFLIESPNLKKDLVIFTVGDEQTAPFRLNPFEPVGNFPLLSHIDLVKSVFNAAFPMYASMPYILEEAILAIYKERGWNLTDSTNRFLPDRATDCSDYLPRLSHLYAKIDEVVAGKQYGPQLTQDISAALKARIGSLTNGTKGLVLNARRSIPMADLLTRPVVLELRKIADDDEKAFIMALVFVRLYEACQQRPIIKQLTHVTLIEEAHRLLRNVPLALSAESANSRGKTVEMFTDMMAEMRAYGEGFIIVDQMPGKLVPDVIKGSNLKVVHRLLAQDDRLAVGNSMGMTSAQIDYLPRLNVGEAIIHSEETEDACLVQIDSVEDRLGQLSTSASDTAMNLDRELRKSALEFYQTRSDVLWRQPGCSLCAAPCTYQPEQKEEIVEKLTSDANRFVTALLVGPTEEITRIGQRLQIALKDNLKQLYGPDYSHGHEICVWSILGEQTAYRFFRAYPRSQNWQALVQLQLGLSEAWVNWPPAASKLNELRQLIGKKIATVPARIRTGCAQCRTKCWFGHRFQAKNHSGVQQLALKLKESSSALMPEEVVRITRQTFGVRIDDRFQSEAAYCLLSQVITEQGQLNQLFKVISDLGASISGSAKG